MLKYKTKFGQHSRQFKHIKWCIFEDFVKESMKWANSSSFSCNNSNVHVLGQCRFITKNQQNKEDLNKETDVTSLRFCPAFSSRLEC